LQLRISSWSGLGAFWDLSHIVIVYTEDQLGRPPFLWVLSATLVWGHLKSHFRDGCCLLGRELPG
jgi:hypothetical protein